MTTPRTGTRLHYAWVIAMVTFVVMLAAFGAGAIRTELGDYRLAFMIAGVLCLIAGASFILIGRLALRPHAMPIAPSPSTAPAGV